MLLLRMTAMLRWRWTCSHGGMRSIRQTCFLLLPMAAATNTATVASFTETLSDTSFTLSLGRVMMQVDFDVPILPSRGRGGGGAGRREGRLEYRGRRLCLLSWSLYNPVTAVLLLVGVKREVRLLRVVSMMMVEMGVVVNRGEISSAVAIIVWVRRPPYLALLSSLRRPFVLVGEAMRLVSPLTHPLLLLMGKHPRTLVREVAVVATSTHVVVRVVAASLCSNLSANWRWSVIGRP